MLSFIWSASQKIKQGMRLCKTMAGLCGELLCAFLAP